MLLCDIHILQYEKYRRSNSVFPLYNISYNVFLSTWSWLGVKIMYYFEENEVQF